MDAEELRTKQAPLKARMRKDPGAGKITLKATGRIDAEDITCKVETARAVVEAGLHPAAGGNRKTVCSGDMLLEALAACAGVTLKAVATVLGVRIKGGTVRAEGDLDFRGTLGVDADAAVGFSDVRLRFDLDTDATARERDKLIELTERYCVIYQTLSRAPRLGLEAHLLAPGETGATVGLEGIEDAEEVLNARLDAIRVSACHAL